MVKEIVLCDTCMKETRDIHGDIGWVTIGGNINITLITGKTTYRNIQSDAKKHFCSMKCLQMYIEQGKESKRYAEVRNGK